MTNLLNRWKATWNPNRYHGWGKTKNYFEGWYFKIVSQDESSAFAIIPGISLGEDGKQHAFIQLLDGRACKAYYHEFPVEDFQADPDRFFVRLGDNEFSADHIKLNLPQLQGELHFEGRSPWPKAWGAPGIMGWYSFVPFMQCYHGVVSLNHQLKGTLQAHGQSVDFSKGKGYIEKDWGRSFPKAWIWMQCNHFDCEQPASLMASVAHIPWLGQYFVGCLVGLWLDGKLYQFATYTGAKRIASLEGQTVRLGFKDHQHRLEIIATQAQGSDLVSPLSGNMAGKVNESLNASLTVKLFAKEKLIFESKGRSAGMELAGGIDTLLSEIWRK